MATKTKHITPPDGLTTVRARAYASKFMADTLLAEPSQYREPSNSNFARAFVDCGTVPSRHMYDLIRKEFWAMHQDLKEGKLS